jgi:hypothetical protein
VGVLDISLQPWNMPKTSLTSLTSSRHRLTPREPVKVDRVARAADALTRTASECIRLRQRYACLVERGAGELEQRGAQRLVCVGDELLGQAIEAYDRAAGGDREHLQDEWWHRANALWLACREYLRRHEGCDAAARDVNGHDSDAFSRLTLDFDLEASALLFLQQAVEGVRAARPASTLTTRSA